MEIKPPIKAYTPIFCTNMERGDDPVNTAGGRQERLYYMCAVGRKKEGDREVYEDLKIGS